MQACCHLRRHTLALATCVALAGMANPLLAATPACNAAGDYCTDSVADRCGAFPLYADRVALSPVAGDSAATEILSNNVDSKDGLHYTLDGNVWLRRGDQLLQAGHVTWQQASGDFTATDNIRFQNSHLLLRSPAMQGNSQLGTGTAKDIRFRLLGSRGNGHADRVELLDEQHSRLEQIGYSTCSPQQRQWELRAGRVDLDQEKEVGYAHNVTMRIGEVPVLWLPWLRFPTTDARHTGFLYPTIGYSESRGFDLTLPFYLNLVPNYDATLYPRLLGRRGFMLGAEFRYLGQRSRGSIRADWLAHDRIADDSRSLWRARSTTALVGSWRFNVNINHVSDKAYFEDLGSSLYGNATHLLHSDIALVGRGHGWRASVSADAYQITDPDLSDSQEPYKRLPRMLFNGHWSAGRYFEYGLDAEFVSFRKDQGLDGRRLDLQPWLTWHWQGPWWHLQPRLAWRATEYDLDRNDNNSPSRHTPIASLDAGLVFERDAHWFGDNYTQTLEPRLYYLRVPYRDQSNIPIFDTSRQTFDYWQLFVPNRFSGPDRQMNANNLTLALTTRLLDDSGIERLSAGIGQIRYFEPQRVTLRGGAGTDWAGSAYVAHFGARLSERWRLDLAQQWNPNTDRTDLSTVTVQRQLWRNGILNLGYRYRRGYLEQTNVSALLPLSDQWNLVARWNYDLDEDRTLGALAGVEYNSCCLAVRLVARHYVRNSAGEIDNTIMLQVEFKGLGSVGRRTDTLLRHAILGYRAAGFDDTLPAVHN